ncbi:NlpC/P60 family protein [Marivita sp.]|uniref:C40 family peptidase n=1 Tax=Marivita sp. TaxID=2003365 RepID=UPI0025C0D6E1|nr:NlpC/P60 family protein [Marivita sp.]
MDRRAHWSNDSVAHSTLRGQVEADRFTDGTPHRVIHAPAVAICKAPAGARDRELLWGQAFNVLGETDGWAFGYALHDGYTGYIDAALLAPMDWPATHRVSARQTMALGTPDFKATQATHVPLSLGSELCVTGISGKWATIQGAGQELYVPAGHLTATTQVEPDPVAVAYRLIGTPYVWGGNTAFGVDCSGLVQLACTACGLSCPGDSDQQMAQLGATLDPGVPPRRGDLLFWKGHVGWVSDPDTCLHANAYHMATALEPLQEAITRIEAQGDGPILRHARLASS